KQIVKRKSDMGYNSVLTKYVVTAFSLIQSVIMEMSDEMVTCSSHNIYPVPQVTWATDPPSAQEALENSTIKTTDHKGLFTVVSTLRILDSLSNYTYFCSFISADKTQVWTASWKNHEGITHGEGHALSIPCITPHSLQNFSLTWTFTSSSEPTVILRYDTKTKHTFNLWEGQAELDQDLLFLGDGSLLLHKPDTEEHSGTYTCTFSGLQSKHIVQTKVNITVSPISENLILLFCILRIILLVTPVLGVSQIAALIVLQCVLGNSVYNIFDPLMIL
uniref:Ig-like domain-containing protein n=1 Tax=Dicentrarchus labrax TaxID=13489 RepID=A0A8C4E178_DICLA